MEPQIICPSCNNQYDQQKRIPKILQCGCNQSVCAKCIDKYYQKNLGFKCPFCNNFSHAKAQQLKDNKQIINFLKNVNVTVEIQEKCSKHNDVDVEFYCFDDDVVYCQQCSDDHKKHQIICLVPSEGEGDRSVFDQFGSEVQYEEIQNIICGLNSGRKFSKKQKKNSSFNKQQINLQSQLNQLPKQVVQMINQNIANQATTILYNNVSQQNFDVNQVQQNSPLNQTQNIDIQEDMQKHQIILTKVVKYFTVIPCLNQLLIFEIQTNQINFVQLSQKITTDDDFHVTFIHEEVIILTGGIKIKSKTLTVNQEQNSELQEDQGSSNLEQNLQQSIQQNQPEVLQQFTFLKEAYIINITGLVKKIQPMKFKRACHASLYHDDYVFVFSGVINYKKVIPQCEKYNVKKNFWSQIANITIPVLYCGVIQLNGNIYIFGGVNQYQEEIDSIQVYQQIKDK